MARKNKERMKAATPEVAAQVTPSETNTAQGGGLSFVVPTEFVELPSKGAFYGVEHPLHNQEVIEIRHMTAKDEDILTSRALLKKGLAIDRLLQNIIVNKNIDVDSLLVGDRNAVLVETRIHAYGPEYNTRAGCPACGTNSENIFNLTEVGTSAGEWADMNVEGPTANNTFLITLPKTGLQAEVRLLTGADEKQLLRIIENRRKNKLSETPVTMQMKQFVVSIDGHTNRTELNSFIDNMPTLDAQYLRVAYNAVVPNIDMTLPYSCGECGTDSRLEVPFTAEFFWPNR